MLFPTEGLDAVCNSHEFEPDAVRREKIAGSKGQILDDGCSVIRAVPLHALKSINHRKIRNASVLSHPEYVVVEVLIAEPMHHRFAVVPG
ncbi:MAG: hypothetical protein BWY82_02056 [Verrucomicrobia bacterium ADurb.Bin474]|nr:MAG: hypothetical protein BWY82_02056 [Verrucomicrobia bacterium ADurb.Bin474]